jgi:alpha-tubulin suppressor-like RCC1 family protein
MKLILTTIYLVIQWIAASSCVGEVIGWGVNVAGESTGVSDSYIYTNNGATAVANYFGTGVVTAAGQILTNVVEICAGAYHSLAVKKDGTVTGFGGNIFGEAIGVTNEYPHRASGLVKVDGRVLSNVVSVAADHDFSLALKGDGTVATWGQSYVPAGITNVVAIAAELGRAWVLKMDGTVVGWSTQPFSHDYHRLHEVEGVSNAVAISVGPGGHGTRGVALRRDGTVTTWYAESAYRDDAPPEGLSNVVAVVAGDTFFLALTRDSTVTGWGFNDVGQATGVPTTNAPYMSPARRVMLDGQILSNVVSVAASRGFSLALKKDVTVIAWGRMNNNSTPTTVPSGLSGVVAIAAGENYCLAITTNETVINRFRK